MATTTNYSWSTPDDTALVKDGAAAIRTLGSSIDTTTKALNPSTTLGDIEYRSATANTNTRLGIGTTGQVLTVSGGVPTWATPAGGGGKVLQVVHASTTTQATNSTSTYSDTNLTATITPSAVSSKVLVIVSQGGLYRTAGSSANAMNMRLSYGASSTQFMTDGVYLNLANSMQEGGTATVTFLISTATTSAVTFKTQFMNSNNTAHVAVQSSGSMSTITLMEIGA